MNWQFWKKVEAEAEPPIMTGASVVVVKGLTDSLGREVERIIITAAPGWRGRYVRDKGVLAIEVYRLKGTGRKPKEAETSE